MHGLWHLSFLRVTGSEPEAVEGAQACTIGHECFVFGGFARGMFDKLRVFNLRTNGWRILSPRLYLKVEVNPHPKARSAHSFVAYKDKAVLFGGNSAFMHDIGMRESFNDLWFWVAGSNHWVQPEQNGNLPKKRMAHGCSILGGVMLVMGGVNTEFKTVLDDFNLYDFISSTWLKVSVSVQGRSFEP